MRILLLLNDLSQKLIMKTQFKTDYLKPAMDVLITEVEDLVALSLEEETEADSQDARTKEENWFIFKDEW